MDSLQIKSLGPIKEANIEFGNLTFFVGPQASGNLRGTMTATENAKFTSIRWKVFGHC